MTRVIQDGSVVRHVRRQHAEMNPRSESLQAMIRAERYMNRTAVREKDTSSAAGELRAVDETGASMPIAGDPSSEGGLTDC